MTLIGTRTGWDGLGMSAHKPFGIIVEVGGEGVAIAGIARNRRHRAGSEKQNLTKRHGDAETSQDRLNAVIFGNSVQSFALLKGIRPGWLAWRSIYRQEIKGSWHRNALRWRD